MEPEPAELEVLSRQECLALLTTAPVGRIVFTDRALPAIQPVNFVVDDGHIVIRTAAGSKLAITRSTVVAFEVDGYDAKARTGWYVTVTGHAHSVDDPDEIARMTRLPLHAWAPGRRDHFIRVHLELVSGRRIRRAGGAADGWDGINRSEERTA